MTLSGKLIGVPNIEMSNAKAGQLTISGAPVYDGTYAKAGSVYTEGDVTINLDNEGAAVSTRLTMVEGKTLTLTQGYVKELKSKTATSTSATAPKVTVALGTDSNYKNVILNATNANFTVTGTTKWNGEVIGGSINSPAEQTAAGIDATAAGLVTTAWEAYADAATAVYTATGLVMNNAAFTLANNIDLNEKPWTPAATTTGNIDGDGFTISNLKVKVPVDGDAAVWKDKGLGLFSLLANNVQDLTLDGVTIAATAFKPVGDTNTYPVICIGALAGAVRTDGLNIKKVTVKDAKLSSTGGATSIGGLFGQVGAACAPLTLSGVTVTGCEIEGYHDLGGFIGRAFGDVTIADLAAGGIDATPAYPAAAVASSVSNASFKANYNSATTTPAIDKQYLSMGNFIGYAAAAKAYKITCAAADVNATLTKDVSIFTNAGGYIKHNEGVNFYDYVFGQTLIGWSGDTQFTTPVEIKTPTAANYQLYTSKTLTGGYDEAKGTATTFPFLYYINK